MDEIIVFKHDQYKIFKDEKENQIFIQRKLSLKQLLIEMKVPELIDKKWSYIDYVDNGVEHKQELAYALSDETNEKWVLFNDLCQVLEEEENK